MGEQKPLVLVVEDCEIVRDAYLLVLADFATVITAKSFNGTRRLLDEHKGAIVAVTLDYNIQQFEGETSSKATGLELIRPIRKACGEIPIFSASSDADKNEKLARCGCILTDKKIAHLKLIEYLNTLHA